MTTTRLQYRNHVGDGLGRSYYISSTTTAASVHGSEVFDGLRVENDNFWNGSTIRINSEDRLLGGGAGTPTNRIPSLYPIPALTVTPAVSTNYELVKSFTFTQMNEAIDDALGDMWPYFYDPIDDYTTVTEVALTNEYALPETWRDIYKVERQILNQMTPVRYRELSPAEFDIIDTATAPRLILNYITYTGAKLRFGARAIPTLGATDASTSIHPWQVLKVGALANLFDKGASVDAGQLSQAWARKAEQKAAEFRRIKAQFAQHREARQARYPVIGVGSGPGTWWR